MQIIERKKRLYSFDEIQNFSNQTFFRHPRLPDVIFVETDDDQIIEFDTSNDTILRWDELWDVLNANDLDDVSSYEKCFELMDVNFIPVNKE